MAPTSSPPVSAPDASAPATGPRAPVARDPGGDVPTAVPARAAGPWRDQPGVPAAVWWICVLHLALLVGYSVLAPAWRGPDEPNHVDAVLALRDDRTYPAYDDRVVTPGIRGALAFGHFERRSRHLTAAEAVPRADRPSLAALEDEGLAADLRILNRPGVRNHITDHPPGYYLALAVVSEGVDLLNPGGGLGAYDREVGVLRVVSLLFMAPLPLVAWWVARVAGAGPSAALTAATLPLAVPQLTHISALVNNDGVLALLLAVLTGVVVCLGHGRVGLRTVAVAGAVTGLALFTKALAFAIVPWVVLGILVGRRRSLGSPRLSAQLAVFSGATLLCGGWWWVANLVNHGDISPSIEYETRLSDPPDGFTPDFGDWAANWVPKLARRFWGDFGWIDTHVPAVIIVGGTAVAALGLLLAMPRPRGRPVVAAGAAGAPGGALQGGHPQVGASGTAGAPGAAGKAGVPGGIEGRRTAAAIAADRVAGPNDHDQPYGDGTAAVALPAGGTTPRRRPGRRRGGDRVRRDRPGRRIDKVTLVLLLAPFLLLHFFAAGNSFRLYRNAGFSPMVQGRYLFGGVAGVAVVVAFGWTRVLRRFTPLVALAVVVGTQAVAVLTILRYYWGAKDASLVERLQAVEAWSPWPYEVNAAILAAVPLVLLATLVAVARACRRPRSATRPGTATHPAAA
ncbi:MAG TPA: hypothetical protein VK306_06395 [Acidimicrobiales bacterium]|nr:hypothetical protein [Acidimicrobiales bacterium]